METAGKVMILIGLALVVTGIFFYFLGRYLGNLPGDIVYRRGGVEIYFPIASSLLLSLLLSLMLTVLLNLFVRR